MCFVTKMYSTLFMEVLRFVWLVPPTRFSIAVPECISAAVEIHKGRLLSQLDSYGALANLPVDKLIKPLWIYHIDSVFYLSPLIFYPSLLKVNTVCADI